MQLALQYNSVQIDSLLFLTIYLHVQAANRPNAAINSNHAIIVICKN